MLFMSKYINTYNGIIIMTTINNSIKVFLPEDQIKDIIPSIQKAVDSISDTTNTHRFMSDCHPWHGTTFVGWTLFFPLA